MSKFLYYIPKLNYPKRGLINTMTREYQKFSGIKKTALINLIVLFLFLFLPWYEIGDVSFTVSSGVASLLGIIIWLFGLSILFIFILELLDTEHNIPKIYLSKWMALASLEIFILSSIGFSISHNISSLLQNARPLVGSFWGLMASLLLFILSIAMLTNEKPIQKSRSPYIIPDESIEETLDKYLERRSHEDPDDLVQRKPSREQTALFDE